MIRPSAYWDASALLPLCVFQPQTPQARLCYKRFELITWWATEVEVWSGLARLSRMGLITSHQFQAGKRSAEGLARRWLSVRETRTFAKDACALLEQYSLRAGDALQLAAALEAARHKPRKYAFITADERQAAAARQIGFAVEFL